MWIAMMWKGVKCLRKKRKTKNDMESCIMMAAKKRIVSIIANWMLEEAAV